MRLTVTAWRCVLFGAAILLAIVAAVTALAPSLPLRPFAEMLVRAVSERVGAEVQVGDIAVDLVPEPRLVARRVHVSVPGRVHAVIPAITYYPDISRILSGRRLSGRYHCESPQVTMAVSSRLRTKNLSKPLSLPENLTEVIIDALSLGGELFGTCTVSKGEAFFQRQDCSQRIHLQNIQVFLRQDGETILFECRADAPFCNDLSFSGRLAVPIASGRAALRVRRCLLQPLAEFFIPTAQRFQAAPVDAEVAGFFVGQQGISLKADVFGWVDQAEDRELPGRYRLNLESLHAEGTLRDGVLTLSCPAIRFRKPAATLSADLSIADHSPRIRCSLASTTLTVTALRKAAISVAPDSGLVQKVQNIVRAGRLSSLRVLLAADHASDLLKADSLRLEALISRGSVIVPREKLLLEDLEGTVTIDAGILKGFARRLRFGAISGEEGCVTVDLLDPKHPFDLTVRAESELIHLLPILQSRVRNQTVSETLDQIHELRGKARGTLTISGGGRSTRVSIMADRFNLHARFAAVPFPVRIDRGSFSFAGNTIAARNLVGAWGASSFSDLTVVTTPRAGCQPLLTISCPGTIGLALQEFYPWLCEAAGINRQAATWIPRVTGGTAVLEEMQFSGCLQRLGEAKFHVAGHAEQVGIHLPALGQSGTLTRAVFEAVPGLITLSSAEGQAGSAIVSGNGFVSGYPDGRLRAEAHFQGAIPQPELSRIMSRVNPVRGLEISGPVSISRGTVSWEKARTLTVTATLTNARGVEAELSLWREPQERFRCEVTFAHEQIRLLFGLARDRRALEVRVAGMLTKAMLDDLLVINQILHGWISGNISARIVLGDSAATTMEGEVSGEDVSLPGNDSPADAFSLESFALRAANQTLSLDHAVARWSGHPFGLTGVVEPAGDHFRIDLELIGSHMDWDVFRSLVPRSEAEKQDPAGRRPLPLEGRLTVRAGEFVYGGFTWSPLLAAVSLARDRTVTVEVLDAQLCAISTPGMITVSPEGLNAAFQISATDKDLAPMIACLGREKKTMGGTCDLTGTISLTAKNRAESILSGLAGEFDFQSRDGRLYRLGVLSKILTLPSVADIVKIRVPELFREGIAYDSLQFKGHAERGILVCDALTVKGPSLGIGGEGTIDLVNRKLDFNLLVAPLRRVDRMLEYLPLASSILGAEIITVPVKVMGTLEDPSVRVMPVSAIRGTVLGIMSGMLKLPLKLIAPLVK